MCVQYFLWFSSFEQYIISYIGKTFFFMSFKNNSYVISQNQCVEEIYLLITIKFGK